MLRAPSVRTSLVSKRARSRLSVWKLSVWELSVWELSVWSVSVWSVSATMLLSEALSSDVRFFFVKKYKKICYNAVGVVSRETRRCAQIPRIEVMRIEMGF